MPGRRRGNNRRGTRNQRRRQSRRSQSRRSQSRRSQSRRSTTNSEVPNMRGRPTTLLDTIGVNIPTPVTTSVLRRPGSVAPENLVEGKLYYIKYLGLHRSEHSSIYAGVYVSDSDESPSDTRTFGMPKKRFTNLWRMIPEHLRNEYTIWVKLDWDSEFEIDKYEFYSSPSEYSKWESIQNQLARDSKLKNIMLYNTYLKVFGEGNHPRRLMSESESVMHR